ncbi:MAG: hypothetical protein NTY53_25315 [Kiritimatiellaeota bacterium]|nr:hypothetical protein [Kiritimatiellota bacterium]
MTIHTDRFIAGLPKMARPGSGSYHPELLGHANRGIAAGYSPADVFKAIREATPRGSRTVPDSEIEAAVAKAVADVKPGQRTRWNPGAFKKPAAPTLDAGKFLRGLLAGSADAEVEDLRAMSPIKLSDAAQSAQDLDVLYQPTDLLFIGDNGSAAPEDIKPAGEWRELWLDGHDLRPQIIPNPLTGQPGLCKDGKTSYRCDACVAQHRFAVVEFDLVPPALRDPRALNEPWPFDEQAKFWAGAIAAGWPVAALIHSGGKSIHAWLAVNAASAEEWARDVEQKLFGDLLVPLGVDSACKNESRLSRMPGAFRADKQAWQRLLYLNPRAGEVMS